MIVSTKDKKVKWEGRELSVDATVDFWVRHNACDPTPERTWLLDRGRKNWTRVRRDVYKGKTTDSLAKGFIFE